MVRSCGRLSMNNSSRTLIPLLLGEKVSKGKVEGGFNHVGITLINIGTNTKIVLHQ